MQVWSDKYPQIDWNRIMWHVDWINKNQNESFEKKKHKLSRAQLEVNFIGATRNDATGGLRSAI